MNAKNATIASMLISLAIPKFQGFCEIAFCRLRCDGLTLNLQLLLKQLKLELPDQPPPKITASGQLAK
jgi:hypothetical protein